MYNEAPGRASHSQAKTIKKFIKKWKINKTVIAEGMGVMPYTISNKVAGLNGCILYLKDISGIKYHMECMLEDNHALLADLTVEKQYLIDEYIWKWGFNKAVLAKKMFISKDRFSYNVKSQEFTADEISAFKEVIQLFNKKIAKLFSDVASPEVVVES